MVNQLPVDAIEVKSRVGFWLGTSYRNTLYIEKYS
jgi:hypothetical protein